MAAAQISCITMLPPALIFCFGLPGSGGAATPPGGAEEDEAGAAFKWK